jgi:DNA-binding transcriptional ArsR family regulator
MDAEMGEQMIGKVVERLRALADESRVRMLLRLKQGDCNVTTLADELGIGQASVSKHLGVLRRVGLVDARRRGTQAIYGIRDQSIFELCKLVCDGVVRHVQQEHAALGIAKSDPPTEKLVATGT